MNYFSKWLLIAMLASSLGGTSAFAQGKIATVDLLKVFKNYWKTKVSDTALQERRAELEKEFSGMKDDLKKASEEYSKLSADASDQAVSSDEREKRKTAAANKLRDIEGSKQQLEKFGQEASGRLTEQKNRMREGIVTEIRAQINAKAKAGGYAQVLDKSAETGNGAPLVLFDAGDNDITEAVLDQLNAGAPIDTSKSDTSKDDAKPAKK